MGNSIPSNTNRLPYEEKGGYTIPYKAAEVRLSRESEEDVYKISFRHYYFDECKLNIVKPSCHKKLLNWFKKLGLCKRREDLITVAGLTNVKPINGNDGKASEYTKLSNHLKKRLSEDVAILHQDLNQQARMFYYIYQPEKILYVLLVSNQHW